MGESDADTSLIFGCRPQAINLAAAINPASAGDPRGGGDTPPVRSGLSSNVRCSDDVSILELSMTRFVVPVILLASLLASGRPARALQGNISVGGRVGTLGMGAEVTVALNERVAIRGGIGFFGFEVDVTERSNLAANRTAKLSLPGALLAVGVERSFGVLRAEAGLLMKSGDPAYEITYGSRASIDIGGGYYREP
ncbi:MAG: hypothetical protein F4Z78_14225, partial [Gammaproteobacteria bacterium]|nr:hypothetical protein [Gammaproteobacteria bacterium]